MAHEMGHAMKMVASNAMVIPGIADPKAEHGRWYDARGHQGDHCAEGVPVAVYSSGADLDGQPGTCVMFGESDTGGPVDFCDRCKKILLPVDISSVA